jgi:hypothetical protein
VYSKKESTHPLFKNRILMKKLTLLLGLVITITSWAHAQEFNIEDITNWKQEIKQEGTIVNGGDVCVNGNLVTYIGTKDQQILPYQDAYTQTLRFDNGEYINEYSVPAINAHSSTGKRIVIANGETRTLVRSFVGPPGSNQSVIPVTRIHSYNPANNSSLFEVITGWQTTEPKDLHVSENINYITGDVLDYNVTPCGGRSFFVGKINPANVDNGWYKAYNTTVDINWPEVHTHEFANSILEREGSLFIAYDSHNIDNNDWEGRVAKIDAETGEIIFHLNTNFIHSKKILPDHSPMSSKFFAFGETVVNETTYPSMIIFEDTVEAGFVFPLGENTTVYDAELTDDGGYLIVGVRESTGFILKINKFFTVDWVSYPDLPVIAITNTGAGDFLVLLQDYTNKSVWVLRTQNLSTVGINPTKTTQESVKIWSTNRQINISNTKDSFDVFDANGKPVGQLEGKGSGTSSLDVSDSGTYIIKNTDKTKKEVVKLFVK